MKKKVLILSMVLVVLFQFVTMPTQKANAIGLDTAVKVVAGSSAQKLLRAIGEKIGRNLSKKQLDDTTSALNARVANGDPKATEFARKLNSATGVDAERPAWKKYALDPMLWLTGADLLVTIWDGFNDAYNNGGTIPLYGVDASCGVTVEKVLEGGRVRFYFNRTDPIYGHYRVLAYDGSHDTSFVQNLVAFKYENMVWVRHDVGWVGSDGFRYVIGGAESGPLGSFSTCGQEGMMNYTPTSANVVNTEINKTIINNFNNTEIYKTVYVEVPNDSEPQATDYTNAWNTPLTDDEIEDLVDTSPEEKPTGSSWWEWLLKPLIKAIELISDLLSGIVTAIGELFLPSEDFFQGFFNDIKTSWDGKIPVFGQLGNFVTTVQQTSVSETIPTFEVTMPVQFGGGTFSIIDFGFFTEYRDWILNWIRYSAWFVFLLRMYKRIPRVIGQ